MVEGDTREMRFAQARRSRFRGSPPERTSAARTKGPIVRLSAVALVSGLAATAGLSVLCYLANESAESRLLALEAKQAAAVFQLAVPAVRTSLTSAAEIAEASNGDTSLFRSYMATYVGVGRSFTAAALYRLEPGSVHRVASLGSAPPPPTPPLDAFVRSAAGHQRMRVLGRLHASPPALWYAATATGVTPRFAVLAIGHTDRRTRVRRESAFSELHFALYLGRSARTSQLLTTDVAGVPLRGRTSTARIPFGDTYLTLVATPAQRLGGSLSAWMWWLVAVVGVPVSIAAALIAEWLVRRREAAEALRAQVERLLAQQRGIAESLQRALLPQALPQLAGADVAARYVPGTDGTEVGGDWYDVLPQDDRRVFLVIGDVSGRGIAAASVMASLRFAIRGFVSEGHSPSTVLASTAKLLDLRIDRHFATVLCGCADLGTGQLTFASAGHLLPLLVTQDGASVLDGLVGPPIGIARGTEYPTMTIQLPRAGMLVLFTDGLVERRGEDLDQGMARLLRAVSADGNGHGVGERLDQLLESLLPDRASDDTAVVGVRWT